MQSSESRAMTAIDRMAEHEVNREIQELSVAAQQRGLSKGLKKRMRRLLSAQRKGAIGHIKPESDSGYNNVSMNRSRGQRRKSRIWKNKQGKYTGYRAGFGSRSSRFIDDY